jgi:hypothetical protein
MRITSVVTSVSWIPSEAISGVARIPMDVGLGHYDPPPPDHIDDDDLTALHEADRLRAANRLAAWIEVEDGRIVDAGYSGRAVVGSTTVTVGRRSIIFPGVGYPVLRDRPVLEDGTARFVQTVGARTGAPFPRRIPTPPYVRITGPTTWTTLALEISADGSARHEVVGAAPFPRHWIYGADGSLVAKTGIVDWAGWMRAHDHTRSPWHGVEADARTCDVETSIERRLSHRLMGATPTITALAEGDDLMTQGDVGDEISLVLDGMFTVEVDGTVVAEIGPGAIVGERAVLEQGVRTSTVRATTRAKVATVHACDLDGRELIDVAVSHRREAALT